MKIYIFDVDGTLTPSRQKMTEEFSKFFDGIYSNTYHPNELVAEGMAKYITYEMNLNNSKNYSNSSPFIMKMKRWIKNEL